MSIEIARSLFEYARGHAHSSDLLYNAAMAKAEESGQRDPVQRVFNGPHSISIYYLIGLSLELLLKTAFVLHWTCNGFAPVTDLIMPPWPRMRAG